MQASETGTLGIENLKKGVVGAVTITNAILEVTADSTISVGDAKSLFGLGEGALTLGGVHLGTALAEGADLYPAEQAELIEVIKTQLKIPNASEEKVAAVCDASKVVYESLWKLVEAIKEAKAIIVG